MKVGKLCKLFSRIYWHLKSPLKYARHIGVKVGDNTMIATRYWSSEPYLIKIGANCQITAGVRFHTHGGGNVVRQNYPDFDTFGKIVVEDWAYIGSGSQILPGVTIGEGALVAAGSIVTKSVPPRVVVGGNPAKILTSVEEYINKNMVYNVRTKGLSSKQKRLLLESLPPEKFIKK